MLCLPQGDLPNPGIKPRSPALQTDSLPSEPSGKPKNTGSPQLQGIFPTQELNWGLLNCRQILYQLSYQEIQYNNLAREKYATMLIGFTLKFINHNYSSACVLPRNYITFPWSTWAPSLLDNCFIPVLITLPPSSLPPPLHMITLLLFEGRTSPGPTTSTHSPFSTRACASCHFSIPTDGQSTHP